MSYQSQPNEAVESFNDQNTHQCDRCGHCWEYTGDAERPTCPSCQRKVSPSERLGEPTEYIITDLSGEFLEEPRFDVDATIDTAEQSGEVIVRLGLTKAEAESMWRQISGDGHQYPEDARERVLSALKYNVSTVTQGD